MLNMMRDMFGTEAYLAQNEGIHSLFEGLHPSLIYAALSGLDTTSLHCLFEGLHPSLMYTALSGLDTTSLHCLFEGLHPSLIYAALSGLIISNFKTNV